MNFLLSKLFLLLLLICINIKCFGQNETYSNITLNIGTGNNIFIRNFFSDTAIFSLPNSSFISLNLSGNLLKKNNKSLFIGLEFQAMNSYPSLYEKHTYLFASLILGKTHRFDLIPSKVYLKYTNSFLITSLLEAQTTYFNNKTYKGNPFNNLNLGFLNNLQLYFIQKRNTKNYVGYGLGFDFSFRGLNIYSDGDYPTYIKNNISIQNGLKLSFDYNF